MYRFGWRNRGRDEAYFINPWRTGCNAKSIITPSAHPSHQKTPCSFPNYFFNRLLLWRRALSAYIRSNEIVRAMRRSLKYHYGDTKCKVNNNLWPRTIRNNRGRTEGMNCYLDSIKACIVPDSLHINEAAFETE